MIKRMSPDTYRIIMALILSGILPRTVKTNKAVELINDKKYHRAKLYRDDLKEILGARRVGAGRNFEYDLVKVLRFRLQREGYLE